ncbi:unnamed protein product [Orchesella dallaii]|uniref:F-box domain-containing protein n=1 Tax=Orchesella dallaii TaxID=48710 RepID=A0ABP1PTC4_9HEXA
MNTRLRSSQNQCVQAIQARTQGSMQQLDETRNPLLQYPVLKNLFDAVYLSSSDLMNCRLVCWEWYKASLGRWRKEATLTLTDDGPLVTSNEFDNSMRAFRYGSVIGLRLQELLEMVDVPTDPVHFLQNKSFRKYNIIFWNGLGIREPEKLKFWGIIGPLMTHLTMSRTENFNPNDLAQVLFEYVPKLHSLTYANEYIMQPSEFPYPFGLFPIRMEGFLTNWDERLRPMDSQILISLANLDISIGVNCFPLSWIYFLARVPNIKVLTLRLISCAHWNPVGRVDHPNELLLIVRALLTVREELGPNYFSQLKELHLIGFMDHQNDLLPEYILAPLRELRLGITYLSLDITPNRGATALKQMLMMYSGTLEKLHVYRNDESTIPHQEFPYGVELPHLTHLHLTGPIIKNMNFLQKVPNLRVLMLDYECTRIKCMTGTFSRGRWQNVVLPRMEELYLAKELCGGVTVKGLMRLMPNLKKLRIGLGNEGFAMLCKIGRNLESLVLEPNAVTESAILGIVGGEIHSVPNITDLKELMSFTMGNLHHSTKGQLSNDSIVRGILACQKLKHVSITAPSRASKKVKEMLTSKFPQRKGW